MNFHFSTFRLYNLPLKSMYLVLIVFYSIFILLNILNNVGLQLNIYLE